MGRLAIIFVLGFAVTLGVTTRTTTRRLTEVVESSSSYHNKTRAKDIASSAVELAIYKLRVSSIHDPYDSTISLMGGTARVIITKIDQDGAAPESLKMTSIATYGSEETGLGNSTPVKDTIINIVYGIATGPDFNITGAMSVSNGTQATITSSGTDTLDGHNYSLSGKSLDSSCEDRHALTYGSPAPTITHSGTWIMEGDGGGPTPADTERVADQPNYDALALQLASLADTVIRTNISGGTVTFGDTLNPKIVLFQPPGKASAPLRGAGVFIMDLRGATSDMQFSGTLTWTGLVIVIGDPTGRYKAKWSNAKPIVGALLLTGTTPKWETSNNLSVKYSCDAIAMALGLTQIATVGDYLIGDWWE